jgi:hypothetical protein
MYMRASQLSWSPFRLLPGCCCILLLLCSCGVQRTMTVETNPPGALVYLNGEEVGRSPLTHDFLWYGDYTVELRKPGYETVKTHTWVGAPWWQLPPIDFIADIAPIHLADRQRFTYAMEPASTQPANAAQVLERADYYKSQLEGEGTTQPTTRPAGAHHAPAKSSPR